MEPLVWWWSLGLNTLYLVWSVDRRVTTNDDPWWSNIYIYIPLYTYIFIYIYPRMGWHWTTFAQFCTYLSPKFWSICFRKSWQIHSSARPASLGGRCFWTWIAPRVEGPATPRPANGPWSALGLQGPQRAGPCRWLRPWGCWLGWLGARGDLWDVVKTLDKPQNQTDRTVVYH